MLIIHTIQINFSCSLLFKNKQKKKQITITKEDSLSGYRAQSSLGVGILKTEANADDEVKTRQHKVTKNRADLLKYFINRFVDCLSKAIILVGSVNFKK